MARLGLEKEKQEHQQEGGGIEKTEYEIIIAVMRNYTNSDNFWFTVLITSLFLL